MKKYILFFVMFVFIFTGCNGEKISLDDEIIVPPEIDVLYSKGNANAKVVITEYSDYQCPFCSIFTLETLPLIQEDYLETGKVQFIFKDFPVASHRYAQKASEATYCAGEQNEEAFWQMHVKLFEEQKNLKIEDLKKYAEELDLNVNAFNKCIDGDKYKNLVLRNKQDGMKAGIQGTPTILINDEELIGIHPYENIQKIIETELKK